MENFNVHTGSAFPSEREGRDVIHSTLAAPYPAIGSTDMSAILVQMQYNIGICTAEDVCTAIERFRNDDVILSRKFTYLVGKTLVDGNLDEGSSIKSMLHGAYKYGTQPASVIPDNITNDTKYADFINFDITPYLPTATKIPGYINVPVDKDSIATAVNKYGCLCVRYGCGNTWWTDIFGNNTWDPSKLFPLRSPQVIVSGHAVTGYGYDYTTIDETFTFRNSWSTAWGMNGNGYSILHQYAPTEAWAILPVTPVIPSLPLKFIQQMQYGSMGAQVRLLQQTLVAGGYATFWATGFYGPITVQAVIRYQIKNGIIKDAFAVGAGRVGPLTLLSLNK